MGPSFSQVVAFAKGVKNMQQYIYRSYITTKDGRRIYARWYGKRAFRIPVECSQVTVE